MSARRPNFHQPSGEWTGVSPYGNPYVVVWSDAPLSSRALWLVQRLFVRRRYFDPDSRVEWWV